MRSDDSGRIFYSRGLIFSQFGLPHIVGYNRRMVDALLTTKLYIPHIRPDLVSRPGLLVRLTEGLSRPLILISAPAGYGKTTLLSEWITANRLRVAWLSLDEQDNNALRFWMYVIAAFQTVTDKAFGQNASQMLEASPSSSIQTILTSLLNDIATLSAEVILILDDYHVISNPTIHEGMAFLLEHQPNQLHLVISTRADPLVPLSRLRARGQLTELRVADMRFTADEATAFLNDSMNLGLTSQDVQALETRTEGWIVGLQLAALSMEGRSDTRAFIEAFTGSHHYILEYLADEVLQRQSESLQRFLIETSILTRLCAPLCNRVTARADSAEVLADLNRRNLFITPLDSEHYWFRYHHLFAELLSAHLQRLHANDWPDLHRRAAQWYAENGYASEAVHHALAAPDYPMASQIIVNNWRRLFHQGWVNATLQWLESLPPELVRRLPPLTIAYCWTLFVRGDYGRIALYLEQATQAFEQSVTNGTLPKDQIEYRIVAQQVSLLQAVVARYRGDIAAAITHVEQVLSVTPQISQELGAGLADLAYGSCYLQMGHNYLAAGDLEQAATCFSRSSVSSRSAGNIYAMSSAIFELARIYQKQGRLTEAEASCRDTLALANQSGYADWPALCFVHIALANVLRESKRLSEASEHLQRGLELCLSSGQVIALVYGYSAVARFHSAQGDGSAAQSAWQNAQQLATTIDNPDLNQSLNTLAQELKIHPSSASSQPSGAHRLIESLSEREVQVLRLICEGKSNQEIADELVIALDTVKRHANNIYGKLGVKRRAQAIIEARRLGLV